MHFHYNRFYSRETHLWKQQMGPGSIYYQLLVQVLTEQIVMGILTI